MLLSVAEGNGKTTKPPYVLSYLTNDSLSGRGLPNRVINPAAQVLDQSSKAYYSQDHWGYFNGHDNEGTLVPGQPYSGQLEPGQGTLLSNGLYWLPGADRGAVLQFAQLGSLAKMTYPTGGSTSFEWALHAFAPVTAYANAVNLTPPTVPRHWNYYTYPPGPDNKPAPIVINSAAAGPTPVKVRVTSTFPCSCGPPTPAPFHDACYGDCHVWFKILNRATNEEKFVFSAITPDMYPDPLGPSFSINLPNGEYYLEHYHNIKGLGQNGQPQTEPDPARPYGITLDWSETAPGDYLVGGGLRIAKTVDYDPLARQRLTNVYNYQLADGSSSGTLLSLPQYGYGYQEHVSALETRCTELPPTASFETDVAYFVRSSTSSAPLGVTQGSPIGYSTVTVYHAIEGEPQGSSGKTVYTYTSPQDYGDEVPRLPSFPFAPINSRDWQRGLLTSQTDYRREGAAYAPVKGLVNDYIFYTEKDLNNPNVANKSALGIKAGFDNQRVTTECNPGMFIYSTVNSTTLPPVAQYFNTSTGYALLPHAATALYHPQDATQQVRTDKWFRYGLNHLQLTQELSLTSAGDSLKTTYQYPGDFAVGSSGPQQPAVAALQQLQTAHIVNSVVEKREWVRRKGTTDWQLLAGMLTTFKNLTASPAAPNPTVVAPAQTQVLAPAIPVALPAPTTVAVGKLTTDEHYQLREKFDVYSPTGQLVQRTRIPGEATTYLWGYAQQYPVAEVRNATFAEVVAILGQAVVDQLAGPNPGSSAAVQQMLQPLRTQLKKALVSTYAYDPLVGMTSQTDPSGRTTTYEYDALGRLLRTRDEQGRVLSQQQYHYAQP